MLDTVKEVSQLIKLNTTQLLQECSTCLERYRAPEQYTLWNQPGTKGIQRATRFEWLIARMYKLMSDNQLSPALAFIKIYHLYEKEEDNSRLRTQIGEILERALGITNNNKEEIYRIICETTTEYQKLKLTQQLEVNKKIAELDNGCLEWAVIHIKQKIKIYHPIYKYTVSELFDQFKECLAGYQDKDSYYFWTKPGNKGKTRMIKFESQVLSPLEKLDPAMLTQDMVFMTAYNFYINEEKNSRLRKEIGHILLRMIDLKPFDDINCDIMMKKFADKFDVSVTDISKQEPMDSILALAAKKIDEGKQLATKARSHSKATPFANIM